MMLDIKRKVRKALDLIAERLVGLGLSPHHLTVSGLIFSGLAALSYSQRDNILAGTFLILGGASDAFDGSIARASNKITRAGGVLDSTLDRLGEAVIFTGIILGGYCRYIVGLSAMATAYLVSYIRGRAELEGVSMEGRGIGERSERLIILIIFTFLNRIPESLILVIGLSIVTISQRIYYTFHTLRYSKL